MEEKTNHLHVQKLSIYTYIYYTHKYHCKEYTNVSQKQEISIYCSMYKGYVEGRLIDSEMVIPMLALLFNSWAEDNVSIVQNEKKKGTKRDRERLIFLDCHVTDPEPPNENVHFPREAIIYCLPTVTKKNIF